MIQGGPGTGKTSLALNTAVRFVENNLRVAYVSFNETCEQLKLQARDHIGAGNEVIDKIEFYESLSLEEEGVSLELDRIINHIKSCDLVVIDSSTSLLSSLRTEYDKRVVLQTLHKAVKANKAHLILLVEEHPQALPLETYIADAYLKLEYSLDEEARVYRTLSVEKVRGVRVRDSRVLFSLKEGVDIIQPVQWRELKPNYGFKEGSLLVEPLDKVIGLVRPGTEVLIEVDTVSSRILKEAVLRSAFYSALEAGWGVVLYPFVGVDTNKLVKEAREEFGGSYVDERLVSLDPLKEVLINFEERRELEARMLKRGARVVVLHDVFFAKKVSRDEIHVIARSLVDAIFKNKVRGHVAIGFSYPNEPLNAIYYNMEDYVLRTKTLYGVPVIYGYIPRTPCYALKQVEERGRIRLDAVELG